MTDPTTTRPVRAPAAKSTGTGSSLISSWAVPTAADDATWEAMTRAEQLATMQALFNSPACTTPTGTTVADILARSRAKRPAGPAADANKL